MDEALCCIEIPPPRSPLFTMGDRPVIKSQYVTYEIYNNRAKYSVQK